LNLEENGDRFLVHSVDLYYYEPIPCSPAAWRFKLMGIRKFILENLLTKQDLPIPDDWTIEQKGANDNFLDTTSTIYSSRAFCMLPMKGVSQEYMQADSHKKQNIYLYHQELKSEVTFFLQCPEKLEFI
jgi:hypothetical protein